MVGVGSYEKRGSWPWPGAIDGTDRSVRFFFEIQNISSRTQSANDLIDRQRERIKPGKKVVIKYI